MDGLRLRVKASEYELEAEGGQDFIRQQYEAFRQLLEDVAQKPVSTDSFDCSTSPQLPASPLPDEKISHQQSPQAGIFRKLLVWDERTQRVTSTVIPDGPMRIADTVLLLLLGYRELRGLSQVPALLLNEGLRSAGFNEFRLDRTMVPYLKERLVLRSGVGKGSHYRLTTRGVKHANELVRTLARLIPDPLP